VVSNPIRQVEPAGVSSVIRHGYCIGCGACAGLAEAGHEMRWTPEGMLAAVPVTDEMLVDQRAGRVCPFSDLAEDESSIAARLYPSAQSHDKLGRLQATYAGYVREGYYRESGSSGGMGTWLLDQLLKQGLVDAVVHVGELTATPGGPLFGYRVSRTADDLRAGAKSRYYPVTLQDVIAEVRNTPGRYAFTGVPCFIKAIRLLAKEDQAFGASVAFCIGLVCGHLKSRGFAELLAWQMGIEPASLVYFDFRVKLPTRAANHYGAKAIGVHDGVRYERTEAMQNLYGRDWGMGLFKPKACDYCDDVVAETADITVGDAWLPRYVQDSEGTNLVIVRDTRFDAILLQGLEEGRIHLEPIKPDEVVQSQSSGYTHRREGLAYRLSLADSQAQWRPVKRVAPLAGKHGALFELRHRLRMRLAAESHLAFTAAKQTGDLAVFFRRIVPVAEEYRDTYRPAWKRLMLRVRRQLLGDPLVRRALKKSKSLIGVNRK